jgi:DNA-binding GntR family transcriptional regulator
MTARAISRLDPVVQEAAPLRRKIAASLRQAVQNGTLPPGTRLVEKDLCQELNVSRTSLREALRELEGEGFFVRGARGVVVAQITEDEARNIYSVRAALEGLVAEQFAVHAGDDDFSALTGVVAALTRAYAENDFPAILSEKDRFYEVLCLGAGNLVALDLLNRINSRINRLRNLSRSDPERGVASLREIHAIADALRARDPARARSAAVRHVEMAAEAALRLRHVFAPGAEPRRRDE